MFENFLFARLVGLRIEKGVTQHEMSLALGKHSRYMSKIESRYALPSMETFFCICSYFDITPHDFFADNLKKPILLQRAIDGLQTLDEDSMMLVFLCIKSLQNK